MRENSQHLDKLLTEIRQAPLPVITSKRLAGMYGEVAFLEATLVGLAESFLCGAPTDYSELQTSQMVQVNLDKISPKTASEKRDLQELRRHKDLLDCLVAELTLLSETGVERGR